MLVYQRVGICWFQGFFFPVKIQTDACPYVDAEKTESIKMYQGSEGTNNSNININIH